jgi:coenzyme Q-binding protein COQ10
MKTIRSGLTLSSRLLATKSHSSTFSALSSSQTRAALSSSQTRSFFPNPFAAQAVQTLTASKVLPYDAKALYAIVADISRYHQFLPFCISSKITKQSSPDANGKTWPEEAELVVGFKDMSESFYSRVYCAPQDYIVESVSGQTDTTLPTNAIKHHSPRNSTDDKARNATILTQLRSRWTLKPFPYKPGPAAHEDPRDVTSDLPARMQTQITLAIDYQFANPIYATLSAAAAPKVADKMIEAFEARVKAVLDRPSVVDDATAEKQSRILSGGAAKAKM